MKMNKTFCAVNGLLTVDIVLRLYILWLAWTNATNMPDFYPITKGVKFPEIQILQIIFDTFLIGLLFFLIAKNFAYPKLWVRLHLLYTIIIVILMWHYGGNVIGYYNVFILNLVTIENREIIKNRKLHEC